MGDEMRAYASSASSATSASSADYFGVLGRLLLQPGDELGQPLDRPDLAGVDVASPVDRHAFAHRSDAAHARRSLGNVLRHEIPHVAGLGVADAKALPPARVVVLVRLRVDRVQDVVAVDVEPADAAELVPGEEMFSFLVEDLDAAIAAIGDEQPPLRVHGQRMRTAEFAVPVAPRAKALDE